MCRTCDVSRGVCAVIGAQDDQKENCCCFAKSISCSLAATKSFHLSTTAAVHRQLFSELCPCASNHVVCVSLVHRSRRPNHDNITDDTSNATLKDTPCRTSYQACEAYSSNKSSIQSHTWTYHWHACVPPFPLATAPRYQVNPVLKGNLVPGATYHIILHTLWALRSINGGFKCLVKLLRIYMKEILTEQRFMS